MSPRDPDVPPKGEEIHLPRPSLVPIGMAAGITLILVGVTLFTPILSVAGGILSLVLLVRWIRDTRRDIDELPLDHH
jgi:phosphate starvation-inducible membrane PsiE